MLSKSFLKFLMNQSYRPGHEGSILNGAIDPLHDFIATTGCDGMLHIYSMKTEEDSSISFELLKKIKISKKHLEAFGKQQLEISWNTDGEALYVSGDTTLGVVQRGTWSLTYEKKVGHKKEINLVSLINERYLATTGLDNVIKIWKTDTMSLAFYIQVPREIIAIQYCPKVN